MVHLGVKATDLIRIGDKVISRERIERVIDKIIDLRASGLSQQDAAERVGIDRTFISRLESLGEVRKGKKLALIGFPLANAAELRAVATEEGVDLVLLFTDKERWEWASSKGGLEMLNELMQLISKTRECDAVIFVGSDMRLGLAEAIVGPHLVGVQIGTTPIREDKIVEPETVRSLIRNLKE